MQNKVKARVEKIESYNLKPGDIYSPNGEEYWSTILDRGDVCAPLLVRTNSPSDNTKDDGEFVYRVRFVSSEFVTGRVQTVLDPNKPPGESI